MPLVRVTMIKGKLPDYIKKMSDSITRRSSMVICRRRSVPGS